jgi:hypothetical protein
LNIIQPNQSSKERVREMDDILHAVNLAWVILRWGSSYTFTRLHRSLMH